MARPTKLTPTTADAIVMAVADGLPRRLAAAVAGVSVATLYGWLRAGRKRNTGEFVQFLHRVKKAEADAVLARVQEIRQAGSTQWQAAAWWLERTHPDEFGRDRLQLRELARQVKELSGMVQRQSSGVESADGVTSSPPAD